MDLPSSSHALLIVPSTVARVAGSWAEQGVVLRSVAGRIASAPVAGLSPALVASAADLRRAWEGTVERLAAQAEQQAEGLRTHVADVLETDDRVRSALGALLGRTDTGR